VVDFWLRLGLDGLRLDAVPYLVEAEGIPSENLPPPLQSCDIFGATWTGASRIGWCWLRRTSGRRPRRHISGVAMSVIWPVMSRSCPASSWGSTTRDRFPIVDILAQTPAITETCQWALFRRNHDELTLEMVTEEERLYLYHVYARDPEARVNLGIRRRQLRGQVGTLQSICTVRGAGAHGAGVSRRMPISPPRDESNTTVVCGEWGVLKLYRRPDVGTQPELEIGHVMTTHGFAHPPVVVGALEHQQPHRRPMALAVVQRFVPHTRDAWEYTLARLSHDLRRAQLSSPHVPAVSLMVAALMDGALQEPPPLARQCFAAMLNLAERLGQRTAEMHLTLAAETEDPAFAPQPLTALDRGPLYQSLRNLALPVFQTLRQHRPALSGAEGKPSPMGKSAHFPQALAAITMTAYLPR
jgi:hypothetical protein